MIEYLNKRCARAREIASATVHLASGGRAPDLHSRNSQWVYSAASTDGEDAFCCPPELERPMSARR
eukprot:9230543-Lingulodinium_polyedra.AAC.1